MKRSLLYAGLGLIIFALSCNELKYYHPLPQQATELQKTPHFLEGLFFVSETEITSKDSLKLLRKKAEKPAYFLSAVFDIDLTKEDDVQYIKLEKTAPGELQMRSFISTHAKDLRQYPRTIKNDSVDVNWDIAGHIMMCKGKVRQISNDTVKWVDVNHKKTVELINGHYHFIDNEDITVYSLNKKKIYSSGKDNEDSDLLVKKHKDNYFFCSKEENDSLWRINILEPTKKGFLYYYIATGDYFKENIDKFRQLGKFDQQGERNYIADLSDDAFYQLIADKQMRESLYFYQIEKKRGLALPIALLAVAISLFASAIPRLRKKQEGDKVTG